MAIPAPLGVHIKAIAAKMIELLWAIVIYLMSELTIWGISRVLAPANLQFFSSIIGMVLIFIITSGLYLWRRSCDDLYRKVLKSKVDFINAHMGVGFPIPLVMLDEGDLLGGRDIARIIGNFIVTNLVSWTVTFLLAFSIITTFQLFRHGRSRSQMHPEHGLATNPPHLELASRSGFELVNVEQSEEIPGRCGKAGSRPNLSRHATEEVLLASNRRASERSSKSAARWAQVVVQFPVIVSLLGFFLVGVPVAAATGESRLLDGFAVWYTWIMAVKSQRLFKTSTMWLDYPRTKNAVKTLMNPVLMTTLILVAYTRAKAAIITSYDITQILKMFSRGTPIYSLWTAQLTGNTPPNNPDLQFGAGDAALSILEVGMLIWGFKLFECRRQLFSIAGLFTVLISLWAASLNVFLGVILSRWFGLNEPEALAFAARSTTLALAKPAIEAMNGNLAVNAALVVSNGILGQLVYPYVLDKMGVKRDVEVSVPSESSSDESQNSQTGRNASPHERNEVAKEEDDAMTIASGIAIGINGAAMGVAYLYETKSRAAPYAALSMTVFGVMTVIFTTVEPFKSATMAMAS